MVYYSRRIPSGHDFFGIFRLMLRWKGSLYKIIWKDVAAYLFLYFIISFVYRFGLNKDQKQSFEDIVHYMARFTTKTPVNFVLGFFVAQVLSRWWTMFNIVPWLNSPTFIIQALMNTGKDPEGARNMRLTMVRYLNLSWILCFKNIAQTITQRCSKLQVKLRKERYPDKSPSKKKEKLDVLEEVDLELSSLNNDPEVTKVFGKIITESEIETFKDIARQINDPNYRAQADYWIPLQWCTRLCKLAFKNGYIECTRDYLELTRTINSFRGQLGSFLLYADANVPLVYTQVVIIAVYTFFFTSILERQFMQPEVDNKQKQYDYYFPIFAVMELIFIVGWMRVAMILINPLGNDDEDFPLNMIFDYNMMISRRSAANWSYQYPKKFRETISGGHESYDIALTKHRHKFESDSEGEPEIILDPKKGINQAGGGLSVAAADLHDSSAAEAKKEEEEKAKVVDPEEIPLHDVQDSTA